VKEKTERSSGREVQKCNCGDRIRAGGDIFLIWFPSSCFSADAKKGAGDEHGERKRVIKAKFSMRTKARTTVEKAVGWRNCPRGKNRHGKLSLPLDRRSGKRRAEFQKLTGRKEKRFTGGLQ